MTFLRALWDILHVAWFANPIYCYNRFVVFKILNSTNFSLVYRYIYDERVRKIGTVIYLHNVIRDKIMSKKSTPEYVKEIRRNQYSMDGNIEKIFSECEITSYPINVFQIARKLEFDIIYGKFKQDNVYGVMWDGDEPLNVGGKQMYRAILLNKQDSLERQAFTVAHEIGHFMLHCKDNTNFYERYHGGAEQTDSQKLIEDQADFFAANLLLPKKLMKAYISQHNNLSRSDLISKICKDFLVERATVDKHFKELGYE